MLYISGSARSLAIVLKNASAKKPAVIARFSVDTIDNVTIENGSQKTVIPLFGEDGQTYHDTHAELAELLDKALYNGPYSPSVFKSKGYISQDGFAAMARNIVSQEAHDRDITLATDFDCAGALMAIISQRSYGKTSVLSLPSSETNA